MPEQGGPVFVLHEKIARIHAHGETSHTEHGLTFLVDGWFRMEHGGPVDARPGTITIVPAGVPHTPLDGRDVELWLVGFCATCMGLDEGQPLMSPFKRVRHGALPVVTVAAESRADVLTRIRELRDECARAAPESPELVRSHLTLLLGDVCRAMPGDDIAGADGTLVSSALEMIQKRCFEPISLKDVAAAVHRTPAHVASAMKKTTGYTVGEWITAGRVAEAAARLAHTDDPIEDVAVHVGWKDKTHFIRMFKKAHGVTPAAWRRAHRAAHATT